MWILCGYCSNIATELENSLFKEKEKWKLTNIIVKEKGGKRERILNLTYIILLVIEFILIIIYSLVILVGGNKIA